MKDFFKVTPPDDVIAMAETFSPVETEVVSLEDGLGRVLASVLVSPENLPEFPRATMDGYALKATSSFGAGEGNPAFLTIKGSIAMGETPGLSIGPGEAARISTGAMLPEGADAVMMIEHTQALDDTTIEAYRGVAPGQHVIQKGEDVAINKPVLAAGTEIRPQETGLLAALGCQKITVYKKPVVGIISTGDEIVSVDESLPMGKVRDVNSYTLAGLVTQAGAVPERFGIIKDNFDPMVAACRRAADRTDMILISGGSSMGTRDLTVQVLGALPESRVLVHGISISPGKPTILARTGGKPFWGLPGQVTSAMVAYVAVVRSFVYRLTGKNHQRSDAFNLTGRLSRNISSVQGRIDYVRVRLEKGPEGVSVHPILGKSGLINTMVQADGLVAIGMNVEGLEKGDTVDVLPI